MWIIDHPILGRSGGGATRTGDVFDPNTGQVLAQVNLGTQATLDTAILGVRHHARLMALTYLAVNERVRASHQLEGERASIFDPETDIRLILVASQYPTFVQRRTAQ